MVKTPTFATSTDGPSRINSNPCRTEQWGFTLIELLVVMAIGALLVGLAPTALVRFRDGSQYRDTVRAVIVDLRQARQQALVYKQMVRFQVNVSDRQFGIEGVPPRTLPASLELKATVGTNALADIRQQAIIAFLPDGGSNGGTLELLRQSGGGVRIRVDWLTGQVTQEPGIP
jgi:general secretion pathway protein H